MLPTHQYTFPLCNEHGFVWHDSDKEKDCLVDITSRARYSCFEPSPDQLSLLKQHFDTHEIHDTLFQDIYPRLMLL